MIWWLYQNILELENHAYNCLYDSFNYPSTLHIM